MSTVSIYTNKCTGKAFAICIDKKLHLLTAAHVVGTSSTAITGNETVKVLHKSNSDDIALLSAPKDPKGLNPIELAEEHTIAHLETYADKICVQTARSDFPSTKGDSGSPIIVDNKCVAMLVGSCEENGCYVPVDNIHKFIQQYQQLTKLPKIKIPKLNTTITTTNHTSKKMTFCEI